MVHLPFEYLEIEIEYHSICSSFKPFVSYKIKTPQNKRTDKIFSKHDAPTILSRITTAHGFRLMGRSNCSGLSCPCGRAPLRCGHWRRPSIHVLTRKALQNTSRERLAGYRRSKLCNILFTRELARRLAGSGVTANCVHPGFCATGIGNNTTGWFRRGVRLAKRLFAIPPERGARTLIYAAAAPELTDVNGAYFIDCRPAMPSPEAQDDECARRLWEVSARIAGPGG
jgi:hypothetical protein